MKPFVTAIMPTSGSPHRRRLAKMAIKCFLEQTHPDKRLLIINHGEPLGGAVETSPNICELIRERPPTLGELRNIAFDHLQAGEYAVTWDDDDWHAPNRISYQLANLLSAGKEATALTSYINVDVQTGKCFVRSCKSYTCGACCGLLLWKVGADRYPALNRTEDSAFAVAFKQRGQLVPCLSPPTLYVRLIHGDNTSISQHIMGAKRGRRGLVAEEKAHVRHVLQEYANAGAIDMVPTLQAGR